MRRAIATLVFACVALLPLASAAESDDLSLEQQLFNDFAGRLQQHLHKSAALLEKIRQSQDAQERDKLMNEYQKSMRKTVKIHHLMHQIAGDDEGGLDKGMKKTGAGMMKGKKKMGGMGCCMMMGKKGGKKSADAEGEASADEGHGAAAAGQAEEAGDEEDEPAAAKDEHEGHR